MKMKTQTEIGRIFSWRTFCQKPEAFLGVRPYYAQGHNTLLLLVHIINESYKLERSKGSNPEICNGQNGNEIKIGYAIKRTNHLWWFQKQFITHKIGRNIGDIANVKPERKPPLLYSTPAFHHQHSKMASK